MATGYVTPPLPVEKAVFLVLIKQCRSPSGSSNIMDCPEPQLTSTKRNWIENTLLRMESLVILMRRERIMLADHSRTPEGISSNQIEKFVGRRRGKGEREGQLHPCGHLLLMVDWPYTNTKSIREFGGLRDSVPLSFILIVKPSFRKGTIIDDERRIAEHSVCSPLHFSFWSTRRWIINGIEQTTNCHVGIRVVRKDEGHQTLRSFSWSFHQSVSERVSIRIPQLVNNLLFFNGVATCYLSIITDECLLSQRRLMMLKITFYYLRLWGELRTKVS